MEDNWEVAKTKKGERRKEHVQKKAPVKAKVSQPKDEDKKKKKTTSSTRKIETEEEMVKAVQGVLRNNPLASRCLEVSAIGVRIQTITNKAWNKSYKPLFGSLKSFLGKQKAFHVEDNFVYLKADWVEIENTRADMNRQRKQKEAEAQKRSSKNNDKDSKTKTVTQGGCCSYCCNFLFRIVFLTGVVAALVYAVQLPQVQQEVKKQLSSEQYQQLQAFITHVNKTSAQLYSSGMVHLKELYTSGMAKLKEMEVDKQAEQLLGLVKEQSSVALSTVKEFVMKVQSLYA